ncbi:carbohydrate sulfotransferase 6-like [Labrus bergylta]|uniref:carbohydrate sulfotransferase 6-like n=1 Tax=Labrus bergylta TaxID=56723 RepID=UPI0009B3D29C|nr:carbohydrate sulfotransferase 6-like [Labrus bergylta]
MRCRVKLSIRRIFLVILHGAAMVLLCSWYTELSPFRPKPSSSKVHVLLLSSWRSGSSFLGQVFSQHPSVFYLMEPTWHVWKTLQKAGMQVIQMAVRDLLQSIFQCDFSVMETYLPKHPKVSNLFLWRQSRALCSQPACPLMPHHQISNETQCKKDCDAWGLQLVQEACSTYSHVVLKVVRIFELESLYPLLQDPSLDLRIIHLVRDPRAVLRSREALKKGLRRDNTIVLEHRNIPATDVQYQVMQEICRSHVHIHNRAILNPPPLLEGRYKMVRYEDVARNPIEEINAIYEFVGLELTPELEGWIHHMTHGKVKGKGAFKITSRNATDVSRAWRSTL